MNYSSRVVSAVLAVALLSGVTTGCSKRARRERMLAAADHDFQAGQYDQAEVEYRGALQIPPPSALAIAQLGTIYFEEGRISQAYPYLNRAAEMQPTNVDIQVKLAQTFEAGQKFKEARLMANKVLERRPGDELALQILVETAPALHDGQQVQQTIEILRAKDTDRGGYHVAFAILDLQRQQLADSQAELQKALALNPKSSSAYSLLGGVYTQQHDLKQAQQAFEAAAGLSPLRSTARLRYAEFQWQTGATNQAQTNLEQLTAKAPDFISGWLTLMRLDLAERKIEDCRSVIKTILARDPANYDALMESGALSLAQRDGTNAIATFLKMQDLYKNSPQVPYQLALAYLLTGDKTKAVTSFNRALLIDAQYSPAILALAELEIRGNRPTGAVSLLQPLIKQQPKLAKAKLLLADAYMAAQSPSEAFAVYRQLAESFPKDPQLQLLMGIVLEQQGNWAEARNAYNNALALAPDFAAPLEKLINLDVAEKRNDEAFGRLDAEIKAHPKSALPWMLKATVYVSQNQFAKAETALLQAIDLNPDLPSPYLLLTKVYVSSGKFQDALDRLTTLVSKTNSVPALLQIGEIHDRLKHYDAARDAYEKALTFNPQASVALNNLAYLYSEHYGDFDKALKMAEKGRQLAPNDPYTADTLGWVVYKKGQYSHSLPLLQEAATGLPGSAEVQAHLGFAHYVMGEEAPARVALQRAISLGEFPGKEDARRKLALLSIDPGTADAASVALVEKTAKENPSDPVALLRLAAIRTRAGQFREAADIYETLLTQMPENPHATLKLAELYSGPLNQPQRALALAKSAHSLAPEDATVCQFLGNLVYHSGDYPWSLSLFEEAARNNAQSPDLLHDLAWAYYANGNVDQAASSMDRAIRSNLSSPKLEDAMQFLDMVNASKNAAQAQAAANRATAILKTKVNYVPAMMVSALAQEQQGGYAQAQQFCEKALTVYPQFSPAVRLSGILAYHRNEFAKSEQFLLRSGEKTGEDAEANYYLGMDYFQLKRFNDSKQALQRAVALDHSGKFATEAKLVLAKLK